MMTLLLPLVLSVAATGSLQAGVSRADITPREPIRMAGYAARQHPSTGVAMPLWAKALALRDARGARVVLITLDLLRVPRSVADPVAEEAGRRYGLERSRILINASHTHSGPLLWEDDPFPSVPAEDYEAARRYTQRLTGILVDLVGAALHDLSPATISAARGSAGFGANRRVRSESGFQIGHDPAGPVDHTVPVWRIAAPGGAVRAVVFGYACHNTAIGPDSYDIHGDYAGVAARLVERTHPGATALFLQLTAGDQDPYPRGDAGWAERHGEALAEAVEEALASKQQPVRGKIGTAFEWATLPLAPHTREAFEQQLKDPNPAVVRNARRMLEAYDKGTPIRSLPYPVQAVRVGSSLTLIALGGEPVVDYALRARREFPNAVVAGYSNSVKGYIPSERVLAEGGYEAGSSAPYYGLPGPFAPGVEDLIFGAMRRVFAEAGR